MILTLLFLASAPSHTVAANSNQCSNSFERLEAATDLAIPRFRGAEEFFQHHQSEDLKALRVKDPWFGFRLDKKQVSYNGKFWMLDMLGRYKGENEKVLPYSRYKAPTRYLSEQEIQSYLLTEKTHLSEGAHDFVMDGQGRIFVFDDQDAASRLHHSSFVSGQATASAGKMYVNGKGEILALSPESGHYFPSKLFIEQALNQLKTTHLRLAPGIRVFDRDDIEDIPVLLRLKERH